MRPDQRTPPPGQWHRQTFTVRIGRSAQRAFELFCAIEWTPEWLVELRSARVSGYDEQGRVIRADFMAAPVRGGYTYPMNYQYPEGELTITWHGAVKGGVRQIEGVASFTEVGPELCELYYETSIRVSEEMPAWFRSSQQDRPVEQMALAFKRWVEQVG